MEEKRLIPIKRFSGFTSDWSKNKLENLASFSKGKGYSKKDLIDAGHQLILYGRLYTKYETVIQSVDTHTIKQENSLLSKGNEVIVPSSGETKEDIARASAILEPNIIIGGDLNVIIPSKELDSVFLALNISNGFCQSELMKRAQGSSVVHLYNEDLISVTLHFPSIKEQRKIGAFFKGLDERIANQERKIAKVKALKDAYLTEMFPQEGETVPKRRFKGFEDEWESVELSSLTEYANGMGHESLVVADGKFELVNLNSISIDGYFKPSGKYINEASGLLEKNDLIMILSDVGHGDLLGRVAIIPESKKYVLNQRVASLKPNKLIEPLFLYFNINKNQKYFKFKGAGMSQLNISKEVVENFIVLMPSKEEQKLIGKFCKNLDDQIATEEAKLDKLKQTKKAYLEEMFV